MTDAAPLNTVRTLQESRCSHFGYDDGDKSADILAGAELLFRRLSHFLVHADALPRETSPGHNERYVSDVILAVFNYMVTLVVAVANLGWIDFDLNAPSMDHHA